MKVLVSSFHTCSPYALESEGEFVDAIVSFDSHIDTQLLGFRQEVVKAMGENTALFYAAGRASTHVIFSRLFGDYDASISVLMPKVGLETDLASFENKVTARLDQYGENYDESDLESMASLLDGDNRIQRHAETIRKMFGVNIITCPPKDPVSTVNKIFEHVDSPVIDIDVDYFADMQNECYTPLKGARPSDLGNLERVLRIIRSVRPELITVSEATKQALDNPQSKTNLLLNRLKNMGYEIEYFFVYDSDEYAQAQLTKWEGFGAYVQENIASKYWKNGMPNIDQFSAEVDEIGKYAKEYFK